MAVEYVAAGLYADGHGWVVTLPKARGECLRWLKENGEGKFDYRFPTDMGDEIIFTFSDEKTAALFRLFFQE